MHISVGKTFKDLRTSQHISLKDAVKNIDNLSITRLSHWENDNSNIPLYKLYKLLINIHVFPNEFAHLIYQQPVNIIVSQLNEALSSDDKHKLHSIAMEQLNKYNSQSNESDLFLCVLACSSYFKKTKINLFSEIMQEQITYKLSSTSLWNYYHISIFENILDLLLPQQIYKIACSLIKSLTHIKKCGTGNYILASISLLNANSTLIAKKPQLGFKLFNKIDQIEFHEFDYYSSFYKTIIHQLIKYQQTKNNNYIDLVIQLKSIYTLINKPEIEKKVDELIYNVRHTS